MAGESALYKQVMSIAEDEFACWIVDKQVGTRHGIVDVMGLRELQGDYGSTTELIAFEVKEEKATFLKSLGQTFACSVYAHKCYLAVRKRYSNVFSNEERDIATQFGIGLIEIKSRNKYEIVATSRKFMPEKHYTLQIFNKLKVFQCSLCHGVFDRQDLISVSGKDIDLKNRPKYRGYFNKAIRERKNISYGIFELHEQRIEEERDFVHDERFLCKDCVTIFASLLPKE